MFLNFKFEKRIFRCRHYIKIDQIKYENKILIFQLSSCVAQFTVI